MFNLAAEYHHNATTGRPDTSWQCFACAVSSDWTDPETNLTRRRVDYRVDNNWYPVSCRRLLRFRFPSWRFLNLYHNGVWATSPTTYRKLCIIVVEHVVAHLQIHRYTWRRAENSTLAAYILYSLYIIGR